MWLILMIEYFLFIVGFVFLIKGADFFVEGSSCISKKLGVPSLIIGLTVVAFGTSMPELIVNIFSALNGVTDIAIGNVIGSNIANILLVLGLMASIRSIKVSHSTIWKEIPFSLFAGIILFVLANDLMIDKLSFSLLTRTDGVVMISFFVFFLYYVFEMAKEKRKELQDEKMKIKHRSNTMIVSMLIFGIAGLFLGGKWVVDGAVFIAKQLGVSNFLISATVVALGTSLPELVTSLIAMIKRDVDLAVGGIVGSSIFNIFWILGVTSLITPISLPEFVNFDIMFLIFSTVALFMFMFIGKKHVLDRWNGAIFLIFYILYICFITLRG